MKVFCMKEIELIYDKDCPNVEKARRNIHTAQIRTGLGTEMTNPVHAKNFGSPAVLVDGRDIAGTHATEGNNCRVYLGDLNGRQGVPPVEQIVLAIRSSGD